MNKTFNPLRINEQQVLLRQLSEIGVFFSTQRDDYAD
jgi:hypothetical protein